MSTFDPLEVTHGRLVDTTPALWPDNTVQICGRFVLLRDLRETDMPALWRHLDIATNANLLDYLPWPLPPSAADFWQLLERVRVDQNWVFYAVCAHPDHLNEELQEDGERHREPMGIIAYLNISLANRELEIGSVIFSKALQRTIAATETIYLMLMNAFQQAPFGPAYRRVSWKCHSLNEPSRRAAERIGFKYEGTFRNHIISQGRNRDTAWFSIIEEEWLLVDAAIRRWMEDENFDQDKKQIRKLEDFRV
ncbi:Putative GNAT domain, acyl-CoA N-acyltransferase [Septoria linicola]|uniref:GNAT domain, acyl-CoA N-acyltransferase n=1 Tax=Septoria linicola TaxID=215465 RepID=A0A9Q9ATK0_9PEZI|nr:putative GNAT domain, acyl-CoA N-acyltransferase [Septoria linicola]USW52928.1 Putative GNAT domain, acyl-CoA N-acyltransferase [Septoria linicola]